MFEIVVFVIIWLMGGYASAILTLRVLNGELMHNDWWWAVAVAPLGLIQTWICMQVFEERQ